MADQPVPGNGPANAQPREQESMLQMVGKMMLIWAGIFILTSRLGGGGRGGPADPDVLDLHQGPSSQPGQESKLKELLGMEQSGAPRFPDRDAQGVRIRAHKCLWREGQRMDLRVYVTETEDPVNFQKKNVEQSLVWQENGLVFGWVPGNDRAKAFNITAPPSVQHNGTLWAHVYLTKESVPLDPREPGYNDAAVLYKAKQLNRYRVKKKDRDVKSLLADGAAVAPGAPPAPPPQTEDVVLSYWVPTLSLSLVDLMTEFGRNTIPAQFGAKMDFQNSTGDYYPVLFFNEFWVTGKHLTLINETVKSLPLEASFSMMGVMKWQLMSQMEAQWGAQQHLGMGQESDTDGLKEMLSDTNPVLLAVTFAVSMLHTVFDFLAFKNDVSFWRQSKSLEGLSVRSIMVNCFFQLVILLYLADNNTSWVILISSFVGVLIEFWKVGKAFTFTVDWNARGPGRGPARPGRSIPRVRMEAKESYLKGRTREFDEIAMNHLLFVLVPLVLGYSAYSLVHQKHRGWYSWIVSSLVGFVYAFGFVSMTPQLFINYKLKSVAHLPWRAMVYKSLNTFIDDLFAFIIKMPIMHRLSCFRDDIIFFIFLYQRWIYPVDTTRVNEFGQMAMPEGAQQQQLGSAPGAQLLQAPAPAASPQVDQPRGKGLHASAEGTQAQNLGAAEQDTSPHAEPDAAQPPASIVAVHDSQS